jgi:hypothetical protein
MWMSSYVVHSCLVIYEKIQLIELHTLGLTEAAVVRSVIIVLHPGKGGCADPVNEDAILERVGGRPPGQNRERQLASDTGDGKT